jgi:hypothetical protein
VENQALFVIANWIASKNGYFPDLPRGCGGLLLAGSSQYATFGLFKVSHPTARQATALASREVPRSLSILLSSSLTFPPALVGAVHELEQMRFTDRDEFVKELERLLVERLERQRSSPAFLARSREGEAGYRSKGEYVWIVQYQPDLVGAEVMWISDDFQVYSDGIDSFEVDRIYLAERFRVKEIDAPVSRSAETNRS